MASAKCYKYLHHEAKHKSDADETVFNSQCGSDVQSTIHIEGLLTIFSDSTS